MSAYRKERSAALDVERRNRLEYADMQVSTADLLTLQWVLTAKHCFTARGIFQWKHYQVKIGGTDWREFEKSRSVLALAILPDDDDPNEDIALLKLSTPVAFGKRVKAACLPSRLLSPYDTCVAVGWGLTRSCDRPDQARNGSGAEKRK